MQSVQSQLGAVAILIERGDGDAAGLSPPSFASLNSSAGANGTSHPAGGLGFCFGLS